MKTEAVTTAHLEIGGLRVRYHSRGAGQPVLVLHGWGGNIEAVYPILRSLERVASVYAVDMPGFGESDPPPRAWGTGEYAKFVREFLDYLGLNRPIVVGHSFGGRVAIRLAVDFPDRVAKLVLVDSAGVRPKRRARYYRRIALAKIGKVLARFGGSRGQRLRERIVRRAASADYLNAGDLRPTFIRIVNEDLTSYLPHISVPTLLIWGGQDQDTPLEHGQLMEKVIPDAGLVVFERAGHYSYIDEPQMFGRVVRHFVNGDRAA